MPPVLVPLWLALAPMPVVSPADEPLLVGGEPIVRVLTEACSERTGVIDIQAPPDEVFATVLDLHGRAPSGSSAEITSRTPTSMTATLHVGFLAYEATVHVRYEIDATARLCRFYLDPTQTS